MAKSLIDSFNFFTFGQGSKIPFRGYISSIDPTTAGAGVLIGGSQNTFKSVLGSIDNRAGLKRRGPADSTEAGVISSYEWETSLGITRVLRADDGKLQVEFDPGTGIINYYDLLSGLTSLDFSFAPWFSFSKEKDILIFVNGGQYLQAWEGGIGLISYAANDVGIIEAIAEPNHISTFAPFGISSGGAGYVVGDLLTVAAGNSNAILRVDSITDATAVKTVTVNAGGSGYSVGDVVKLESLPDYAALKVTSIGGGGAVTGLQILSSGLGYSIDTNQSTTNLAVSGSPSGLTVDITAVGTGILSWHFTENGTGYSTGDNVATTGGTGTGATVSIHNVTTGRITISGILTAPQLGFAGALSPTDGSLEFDGGTLTVNGVSYTYSVLGDDGFSFIGLSDPTGLVGDVALSAVVTTSTVSAFEDLFTDDFVNVIGNQLYVGCYNARVVHISDILDYTNFTPPSFRTPGSPDALVLDSNARGATSKTGQKGNSVLFGSLGDSYSVTRTVETFITADGETEFTYENVIVDKATSSDLSSPISQNFIDSIGDTIIFLDGSNQLRQFGTLRNLATPVYPILSLDVYTEFANTDFTGGALRAVAEQSGETVYITVPLTGTLYIYQIRDKVDEVGNLRSERLWHPPWIVGCSRVAVVDGLSYVYSNSNPQMYQLWDTGQYSDDSPSDEMIPYESHAIFAYISLDARTQQLFFDKIWYEGFMTPGTTLYNNVYQEYQGSKNLTTVTINKPVNPGKKLAQFYSSVAAPSLGQVSLGLIPLGEGVTAIGGATLPKFRALRRSQAADIYEFALDIASYDLDAQWRMLQIGVNVQSTTRRPGKGVMGITD